MAAVGVDGIDGVAIAERFYETFKLEAHTDAKGVEHIYPGIDEMVGLSFHLGFVINQDCEDTGNKYDNLVVVSRGGLLPAMVMSRMFKIEAPELLSVGITSYAANATESDGSFREGQLPTTEEVEGRSLLIPDDVYDTGRTAERLRQRFLSQGATKVAIATLYDKPDRRRVGNGPDYCVKTLVGNVWIHFLWDEMEHLITDPSVFSGRKYGEVAAATHNGHGE